METNTSRIVREYVFQAGKNIAIFVLSILSAGLCFILGLIPVYIINLGVETQEDAFVILLIIFIPIVVGVVMALQVRGFLNFLKYRWGFIEDYEIYESITFLWMWTIGFAMAILTTIEWYLLWRLTPNDNVLQYWLVSVLSSIAFGVFTIGLLNKLRAEKYRQGILKQGQST